MFSAQTGQMSQERQGMKKKFIKVALAGAIFGLSGCSTYNEYVPDWAKIGSSDTEAESSSDATEKESKWWNPFSW